MLIKVCGLTNSQNVYDCIQMKISYLGFIFHIKSPRYISPEKVRNLPTGQAFRVGVFVYHQPEEILKIMDKAKLNLAQLHGDYSKKACLRIGPERIIKVFWPDRYSDKDSFINELEKSAPYCKYFLLDAGLQGGGHGEKIASFWLKDISFPNPWFLAGGLGPNNVYNSVQTFHPDGVDLNSGIEKSTGQKDSNLLKKVLSQIRSY